MNQQYVRGINQQELMFVPASTKGKPGFRGWMADEKFPAAVAYTNRATYLLAQGRPAASIAVYYPTLSLWLGDAAADTSVFALMQQLLEHQRDFDFVNEEALATAPTRAISKLALDRLQAFAAAGGKVIVLGAGPSLVVDQTFLHAGDAPDWKWALREKTARLTPEVLAALPPPDVALDRPCPAVKCLHRHWRDAELYFFFNEGDQPQARQATLLGSGPAQVWDAETGTIAALAATSAANGTVRLPLELAPGGTQFIVLGSPSTP